MSRVGWLAVILGLVALAFHLKGKGDAQPAPAPTVLDEHLRTIGRAQDAVGRFNDAVWRQREEMAKAIPDAFIHDLEASSARIPLTRAEAKRALEIARANAIAAAWEGQALRIGGAAIRVEPAIAP